MTSKNQQELKAAAERAIFLDFVSRANLPIQLQSVESRKPPEPDILCRCNDGIKIAFELVSLSDPDVAEQVNRREQEPTSAMFLGGANFYAVRNKFGKAYQSDAPIELLCHVGEFLLSPEAHVLHDLEAEILKAPTISFRRIWFMGESIALVRDHIQ